MKKNYEQLKKNRRIRRFLTYVVVYLSLWLAFRSLIEIFRGGDILSAFNEILLTGIGFGLLLGIYSIFKKHTLYVIEDDENNTTKILRDLNFKEPKAYRGGKMLFIRDAAQRFRGHDEVFMTKVEGLIEIECEKNMRIILEEKLKTV